MDYPLDDMQEGGVKDGFLEVPNVCVPILPKND